MANKSMTYEELLRRFFADEGVCDHCKNPYPEERLRYCETCKEYYCADCRARHYGHLTIVRKWDFKFEP